MQSGLTSFIYGNTLLFVAYIIIHDAYVEGAPTAI